MLISYANIYKAGSVGGTEVAACSVDELRTENGGGRGGAYVMQVVGGVLIETIK